MTIWLIWIQGDDATWLEFAMDDETTAGSDGRWEAEVDRVRKMCAEQNYEMRIQRVAVPGVFEMFDIPTVEATPQEID